MLFARQHSTTQNMGGHDSILMQAGEEVSAYTGSGVGIQQLRNEASYDVVQLIHGK